MAKLVKIESTSQMAFTPKSGYVTSAIGYDAEGNLTELVKKADGTIVTIGGGSGSDGYVVVDDNGVLKVQKLSFSGTEASFDGTAETLDATKVGLFATTQDEPAYKGSGGGGAFYKCVSVDTDAKTWTGYLAVLGEDGAYSFEETVTEGLTYTKVIPVIGKTYSADALVTVGNLYVGFDPNTLFLLDVDNMVDKTGNFEVTTQGEFTRSPGLFGNRLEFPSMQMVTYSSSNVSFGGTEDYTVEFFYTRIGDGTYPSVLSAADFQVHSGRYGTELAIWQKNTDTVTIAYDSFSTIGETKHIAFSRRASDGNWKFWVNGQMVSDWNYGTGSANASMTSNSIGNWNNDRNNGFAIEEFRISRGLRYTTDTFDVPTEPLN